MKLPPSAWVVLCAALLATALTSLQVKRSIEDDAVRHFAFICDQITLKIEERLGAAALAGWVYTPERMRYLMDGILRDWERHDGRPVDLHVYRGSGAVPAELLFDNAGAGTPIAHSLFHQRRTLAFRGGEWLLEFDHIPSASPIGYGAVWATLLGGLALSGLLFGLMLALARARASAAGFEQASRRAQQLAEEMKGREAQLQKLSLAVEQSPESIVITDLEGRIEYVNAAFVAVSGYSREEAIGENPRILNSGKTPGANHRAMWDALGAGRPWQGEFFNRRKDGSEYVEFAIVTPMRQTDGRITHYVATKEDITEKKRIGAELEQHRHHLEALVSSRTAELKIERDHTERAGRAKSEFLANMSHEIRTPINAVVGFAHLCLKLDLPARGRDYVSKIGVAAQSLLGIVNDVLDLSKIDAGKLELESLAFSLDEVLEKVAGLFSLKAREKGVELVIAALPGIPERLLGDPLRLGQVLINLVGNALKFTERGEVRLLVKPEAVGAATASLRFEVRDTGIGMTPQQRESLFAAFSQADSSTTRKYGGSGLGLAISKQLVERMQGELGVQSEAGVGSCFSFSARFGVAAGAAAPMPAHSTLSGTRVLVVDDNADIRKLLSANMKTFGCRVEAVESGERALASFNAGDGYDLIVMDWHLPGIDGLVTARRMRSAGSSAPVILITGGEAELARSQAEAGDIQAFLPKPVSRSTLYDSMVTALGALAAPLPPAVVDPIETVDLAGARILLVDDNDFNRQIGRELVEITGATVDTAEDGAQAVAAVTEGRYDLVLMDLQMPVMDGYTAARILREHSPGLPILALTAHALSEERARVLAAGMNDMLTKPILPAALYAMLARWLPGIARRGSQAPACKPAPADGPWVTTEIFDLASALTRVNGEQKMLERFLRLFRERNAGIVADIGAALGRADLTLARRHAHGLKGGAGTVGLIEVEAAAARLEAALALEATDDAARRSAGYAALAAAWTRAVASMDALLDAPATLLPDNKQGEA